MKKFLLAIVLALSLSPAMFGQGESNTITIGYAGVPTGNCSFIMYGLNKSNGDLYDCPAGTWVKTGTGGGGGGANAIVNNPNVGQFVATITPTTAASGFGAGNAACSAFDTNGTTDMACAAATNEYTFLATGSSSFSHGWNYYFQTDLTQTFGYGIGVANILEIPASGQVATDVSGLEVNSTVTGGNPSAAGTFARSIKTRSFISGAGTVLNGEIFGNHWYLPNIGAGATNNGQMVGYGCDNPTFAGTQNGIAVCSQGGGSGMNVDYFANNHATGGAGFAVANPDTNALCDGSITGAGTAGSPSQWTNAGCIGMNGTTVTLPATITPANNSSLDASTTAFVQTAILDSIGNGTQCNVVWGTLYWYCDVYQYHASGDMAQATAAALSEAVALGAGWVTLDARGYSNAATVNASVNAFAALVGTGYQSTISGTWLLPCAYITASAIQTTSSFNILGCASKFNGGSASTQGTDWVLASGVKHAATFAAQTGVSVGGQSTQSVFSLTQATVSGGSVIYTGTIPGGGSNAFAGDSFTITGFVNAGNNGSGVPLIATASTVTTLTLTNAAGVNETHWGLASSTYSFPSTPTSSQVANVQPYEMYVQCTTSTLGENGNLCGGSTAVNQARGLVTSVTSGNIQVQSPVLVNTTNPNSTFAVTYPCAFVVGDLSGTTGSGGFAGFGVELAYMQIDLAQNSVTGAEGICVYNASNLTRVHDITGLPYGNAFLDISSNPAQNMMGPWNFWVTDGGNVSANSFCAISSMTAAIGNWHDFSCALGGSGTNQYFVFDALGDYGPEFHIISQPPGTGTTVGIDLGNATAVPIVRYSTPGNVSGSDVSYINATASGGNPMNELVRIGNNNAATNVHIHNLASKGVAATITNMLVDSNQSGTCSIPYSDSGSTLGDYWIDGAGKSRSNIAGLTPACNAGTIQSAGFTLLGSTSGTCPLTVSATGGTLNICSTGATVLGAAFSLGGVGLGTGAISFLGNTSGTVSMGCAGATCTTLSTAAAFQAKSYGTATNCVTNTSCGSATAGMAAITTAGTTVTVTTSAVTANSEIKLQFDATVGGASQLNVTCNTGTSTAATYWVSTRTPGTSFIISSSVTPLTNPACVTWSINN